MERGPVRFTGPLVHLARRYDEPHLIPWLHRDLVAHWGAAPADGIGEKT